MSIHWRELDTLGKIEAVRGVFEPGMSASQIAAHFPGATRNAVIGLFHRHLEKINGEWELRTKENHPAKPKPVRLRRANAKTRTRKALPSFESVEFETHLCGRPVTDLARHECRWPVNDAGPGDMHLFCGKPSQGPYCDHHQSRAYRSDP